VIVKPVRRDLDRQVSDAISAAKFEPATRAGKAVAACMATTVWPHP
jgi:outer membrane biosynthesis protein TonB